MAKPSSGGAKKKKKGRSKAALGGPARLEMKAKRPKKENPFERRFGREKHKVLNRKSGVAAGGGSGLSGTVGRPGQARARAQSKRKATLLPEYESRNRAGVFLDKRIGEGNAGMTVEERTEARFVALEKARRRKALFQLGGDNDEEEATLTHSGRPISDMERFDDPRSDDERGDEDEEGEKRLDAKFVGETHFGGFMTKTDIDFAEGRANSRKEWIDKMIADSKARKLERQRNLEDADKLTKDLDGKWRSMFGKLRTSGQVYSKEEEKREKGEAKSADAYDTLLRELGFEKGRMQAKDRLKTEEEVVQEEKEKLEKLEAERLKRMRGEIEEDDDYGKDRVGADEAEEDGSSEEDEDDGSGGGSGDEDGDGDRGSDLENSDVEEGAASFRRVAHGATEKKGRTKKVAAGEEKQNEAATTTDLPFTFTVPESYERLESLFFGRSPQEHALIVERILKCNHPRLGEGNRERLQSLFTFLLQHVHDCAVDYGTAENGGCQDRLESVLRLTPFLYDLAHLSQQAAAKAVLSVIQEKYEEYSKHPRTCPGTEVLIFLKLCCLLFPTSDYRHPVVTPAYNLMSHVLSAIRVDCRSAVATGLYISALLVESLRLSKRFCPELINFLTGIVFVSFPKKGERRERVVRKARDDVKEGEEDELIEFVAPFRVIGPEAELLCAGLSECVAPGQLSLSDASSVDPVDGAFASSALSSAVSLLSSLFQMWNDTLPSAEEVFAPARRFLRHLLDRGKVEASLHAAAEALEDELGGRVPGKRAIVRERAKPKILRQYEPEIDVGFDPLVKKRSKGGGKDEMGKLMHKLKRERKGAKKEIRQDSAFLARRKAADERERDQARIRKTKEILSGLGNQEGDYRKMQKKKRRKT